MSAPQRIQRKRTKGWRMPDGAIYVGRPSKGGNPYSVGGRIIITADNEPDYGLTAEFDGRLGITVDQAVAGYRDLMHLRLALPPYDDDWDEEYQGMWTTWVSSLAGHDLACWCPLDQPCHADVLLELANLKETPDGPH